MRRWRRCPLLSTVTADGVRGPGTAGRRGAAAGAGRRRHGRHAGADGDCVCSGGLRRRRGAVAAAAGARGGSARCPASRRTCSTATRPMSPSSRRPARGSGRCSPSRLPHARRTVHATLDQTRAQATLEFTGAPAEPVAAPGAVAPGAGPAARGARRRVGRRRAGRAVDRGRAPDHPGAVRRAAGHLPGAAPSGGRPVGAAGGGHVQRVVRRSGGRHRRVRRWPPRWRNWSRPRPRTR